METVVGKKELIFKASLVQGLSVLSKRRSKSSELAGDSHRLSRGASQSTR